jgi:hypothetical protein
VFPNGQEGAAKAPALWQTLDETAQTGGTAAAMGKMI